MYSTSFYLLSGVTTPSTGSVSVLGMDKFSVSMFLAAGDSPPTGTINIEARLVPSSDYVTIHRQIVDGAATGAFFQFDGPIENLRASASPLSSGTCSVIARYSSSR
jgi:hypothetical protein